MLYIQITSIVIQSDKFLEFNTIICVHDNGFYPHYGHAHLCYDMDIINCRGLYCDCQMQNSNNNAAPLTEFMSKCNVKYSLMSIHIHMSSYFFSILCLVSVFKYPKKSW